MKLQNCSDLAVFICVLLVMVTCFCEQHLFAGQTRVHNPYEGIDWNSVALYDANFHTHTRLSDGVLDPHQAIDRYHELGYHILALTDHDSHHDVDAHGNEAWPYALYPWTEIATIFESIKDQVSRIWNQTWQQAANEPWQNRDPDSLNMIAVQGSEISRTHDIGSFFNDYAGGTSSEETAFEEIKARDGLSIFCHPGRYNYDVQWYVNFYEEYDHLIGMEVYNQRDRYPQDRALWDEVLYQLMPDRPVWGFANDDMHRPNDHLGWNRNVFPLEELNEANVRTAMEQGAFYFYKPNVRGASPSLTIAEITATEEFINVAVNEDFEKIEWLTFNPLTSQTEIINTGSKIFFNDLPPYATFIRAEVVGDQGKLYTQPFGIYTDITIDVQPDDQTAFPGDSVEFSVSATNLAGGPMDYSWYYSEDDNFDPESVTLVSGPITDDGTLTVSLDADTATAVFGQQGYYYCVVDNGNHTQMSQAAYLRINHLIAYYAFDGNANDSSIWGNDGVWADPALASYNTTDPVIGSASAVFTGAAGSYIDLGTAAAPNPQTAQNYGQGSVSFWIKTTSTDAMSVMGSMNEDFTSAFDLRVNDGSVYLWLRSDTGSSGGLLDLQTAGDSDLADGQWHHVAIVWAEGNAVAYIDGVVVPWDKDDVSGSPMLADWQYPMLIGARNNRGDIQRNFDGELDDLKMYNYRLTEQEVIDETLAGPENWVCENPPLFDFSGNCIVDLADFAIFAERWLECGRYPDTEC